MSRKLVIIAMLAATAALAGCSHSCVPPGWFQARAVTPVKQPPNAKPIKHDSTYDIPGHTPTGTPSHDEACLVTPPNAVSASVAASANAPANKKGG